MNGVAEASRLQGKLCGYLTIPVAPAACTGHRPLDCLVFCLVNGEWALY